jgi:lysophospholipid acyltransferase (LPLAT)-like uncharacterized protein
MGSRAAAVLSPERMKRFLQSPGVQTALARLAAGYLKFVARTTRWRIEGDDGIHDFALGAPCIVAFWHETLPTMPILWLRRCALSTKKPAFVLASRHRDGRLIGLGVARFGIGLVAGSSSRGGAAGFRALINALQNGADIGITPDGPRGPRRQAAPGIAQLAAMTGAKILCSAASTGWAIQFNSWDRMRFPLPFGPGRLVCAKLISVPRDNWQASLAMIEASLTSVTEQAARP